MLRRTAAMGGFGAHYRNAKHLVSRIVMKSTRALGLVVVSLAVLTGLLAGSEPVLAVNPTISLAPTTLDLAANGSGFVDVMVSDFDSLGGLGAYELSFSYDNSVIEITGIVDGDSPFSGGEPSEANPGAGGPFSRIDHQAGEVQVAAFQASQATGPTGNIRIARINITALVAAGATDLTFATAALVDAVSGEFVTVRSVAFWRGANQFWP